MSQESLDIEAYKQATALSKRLAKTEHVRAWIELEGKRLVDEMVRAQFKSYIGIYPSLSFDDLDWLQAGSLEKWSRETERSLIVFGGSDYDNKTRNYQVVRHTGRPLPAPPIQGMEVIDEIRYSQLLPFEMTHLWGGGYAELVEKSLT
jgi:hypothetical protein